jgi:hypothetical protein
LNWARHKLSSGIAENVARNDLATTSHPQTDYPALLIASQSPEIDGNVTRVDPFDKSGLKALRQISFVPLAKRNEIPPKTLASFLDLDYQRRGILEIQKRCSELPASTTFVVGEISEIAREVARQPRYEEISCCMRSTVVAKALQPQEVIDNRMPIVGILANPLRFNNRLNTVTNVSH